MTDLVGKRLGEFEIVRELGRGGMGVVFEAVQRSLNRRVALKVLAPGLGLTPRAVQRFRREAESAAKLHHTNIVPVYATGEDSGFHFYAMELIDGPSLDRVIAELRESKTAKATPTLAPGLTTTGPYLDTSTPTGSAVSGLSSGGAYFDTVARVIADVAEALDHAHQNNVIHRDIKPGNLLLGSDGRLSVNDFGLARALEEPGMTTTGEFVGTPAYMAPEQIAGGRIPVDHRCDIYSLGATLYELLTLRPPFIADRRDQLLAMVIQKEPVAPRRMNPQVPRDLETICLKCLEKDPDRRYRSAKELADDLRRFVNRFAIQAKRAGLLTKAKKWVKRNPALTAAGVAVLLALGAAGVFAYQSHRSEKLRAATEEQHERERREERLHAAMDRAILAALRGDLAAAEQAIGEAESNGATPAQSQLLRGQVAFNRGDTAAALPHLRLAYQAMPDNITARCLLAEAEFEVTFSGVEFNRLWAAADHLTPVTPEDHIYLGRFFRFFDWERALALIDTGLRLRESPVGRLFRCEVLRERAADTADLADAKRAVEAAAVARTLLPDNPQALIASLTAVRLEVAAHAERGDRVRAGEADQQAERFAAELEARFPDHLPAAWTRLFYLLAKRSPLAEPLLLRMRHDLPGTYAAHLAANGQAAEAVRFYAPQIGRLKAQAPYMTLGLLQANAGDRAAAYDTYRASVAARLGNENDGIPLLILWFLGRREEAVAAFRGLRVVAPNWPLIGRTWEIHWLDFHTGELSESALLREAGQSRTKRSQAHAAIGMVRLAAGDREAARDHFRTLLRVCEDGEYWTATARWLLARLDADPNWPPWLPHLAPMPHAKP